MRLFAHASLHGIRSFLNVSGLITLYIGSPIIGVRKVTSNILTICNKKLFDLAETSFTVQIILNIRKNIAKYNNIVNIHWNP